jgi:SAM-dependent methyltransferase
MRMIYRLGNLASKVRRSLGKRGMRATIRRAAARAFRPAIATPSQGGLAWDRDHDVETAIPVSQSDFAVRDTNHAVHYEPIDIACFHKALATLPVPLEDLAFLDLGSGKGRALLLAAGYPFHRVIGVEYSPLLHEIATQNLTTYNGPLLCRPELVCSDVRRYAFPVEPLLVFLFNPFQSEILAEVLVTLEQSIRSHPRPVWVLYYFPKASQVFGPFWHGRAGNNCVLYQPVSSELAEK